MLVTCKKDAEIEIPNYPYVLIKDINEINNNGVLVSGNIISIGRDSIIEYGFVWNKSGNPSTSDFKLSISQTIKTGIFSGYIDNNLDSNEIYWVRPYIKSNRYTVYGTSLQFESQGCSIPFIETFNPKSGKVGSHIKIKASHINSNPDKTVVRFNNEDAKIIETIGDELIIEVPFIVYDAEISIISGKYQFTLDDKFTIITPWTKISAPNNIESPGYPWPYNFSINGKGYFIYGETYENGEVYEFDPLDNSWIKKEKFPGKMRANAVSFSLNNKGYYGLGNTSTSMFKDFWEYDPVMDSWNQLDDFPGSGSMNTVCYPINNSAYIGLGSINGTSFSRELWEYNQTSKIWIEKNNFSDNVDYNTYGTVINNKGYLGFGPSNKKFYEYDPNNDAWTNIGLCPTDDSYLITGLTINNVGYFHYTFSTENSFVRYIWKYTPDSNKWEQLIMSPANFVDCLLINNYGYFLSSYDGFWRFDPNKL